MNHKFHTKISHIAGGLLTLLAVISIGMPAWAQVAYVVDQFDPSGTGGYSYADGQIGVIWTNWFGGAFSNLVWDSASDASNNPASGSMKITANFNGGNNQFEVYDGLYGINPPLNGQQYTNFQCDVRFAQGSATATNSGVAIFGHLQFGTTTNTYGQDYFGSVDIPASNTNWVHVSIPLNVQTDPNLQSINDVLIHIYGPYYSNPGLSGVSILWLDNIQFVAASPVTTNCVVDWNNVHQRIDGFGASSAWDGSWTTNQADILFSTNMGVVFSDNLGNKYTNNGVGLSLLRNHIVPASSASANATPTTAETQIMQWAQARGAQVWSTPWTPPAGFKNANDIYDTNQATGGGINGGSFRGGIATNLAYASQLANYVASMKNTYGVNLYAISIQNEPDAAVNTYEACQWTNTLIHDFVTNLYNALVASNVASTKIMLPESENWQDYHNLAGPAMIDPNVAADVGIIADHNYDGANGPANLTKNSYGKALWETEVSQLAGESSSIANGVYYAQRIFLFMTVAQANAWHYWWLVPYGSNTGLMDTNAAPTKRLFTVGNYSRFVRPGCYRIDVTNNNPVTSISAYKDTNSGNFAIVAVNSTSATVTQIFNLTNFPAAGSVTPWITSSNLSLASQTPVTVTGSSFTYTLPALSVVTFVGQGIVGAPNTPPTLTPVPNQTINAGMTLQVTNMAVDTNLPSQSLAFSLLNGPTNSTLITLNGTNAVFAWRPLVGQANTTNPIAVVVADSGSPNLSATNNFTVTVNPITNPVVGSVTVSGGQVNLMVSGPQGPDYTLLTTTNLAGGWQVLYTLGSTNSSVTQMMDTHSTDPARFYRIQLGP
jgi:glucuronoarabinoxylan endo-1,4-beta-xylanase